MPFSAAVKNAVDPEYFESIDESLLEKAMTPPSAKLPEGAEWIQYESLGFTVSADKRGCWVTATVNGQTIYTPFYRE